MKMKKWIAMAAVFAGVCGSVFADGGRYVMLKFEDEQSAKNAYYAELCDGSNEAAVNLEGEPMSDTVLHQSMVIGDTATGEVYKPSRIEDCNAMDLNWSVFFKSPVGGSDSSVSQIGRFQFKIEGLAILAFDTENGDLYDGRQYSTAEVEGNEHVIGTSGQYTHVTAWKKRVSFQK